MKVRAEEGRLDSATARDLATYVRLRGPQLIRTAYLLTGDLAAAEDVVQNALASMIVSWRRLREVENIDAYVHRSIVNASRRSWRRTAAETLMAEPPDGTVVDHADLYAEHDEVAAALRGLPPRQRAAVVLRYYLDLSEAATAQALGCSVGAVKSQTSRGLAKLRDRLGSTRPEPGPGAERRLG